MHTQYEFLFDPPPPPPPRNYDIFTNRHKSRFRLYIDRAKDWVERILGEPYKHVENSVLPSAAKIEAWKELVFTKYNLAFLQSCNCPNCIMINIFCTSEMLSLYPGAPEDRTLISISKEINRA